MLWIEGGGEKGAGGRPSTVVLFGGPSCRQQLVQLHRAAPCHVQPPTLRQPT
jgi:hypothetical protein